MAVVTGSIRVGTLSTQTPTTLPGTITPATVTQSINTTFGNATTADNVDLKYTATLTFTASTAQTLDLTALTDIYGGTVNFARIRSITISITSPTTDGATLTIGAAGTNPWAAILGTTGTYIMQAPTSTNASMWIATAPNTTGWITGGSSKNLKLTPSAHAIVAAIEIMGASA